MMVKYYLFSSFNIDLPLRSLLPWVVDTGIEIVVVPSLEHAAGIDFSVRESTVLACFVYPSYGLPGTGMQRIGVKIDEDVLDSLKIDFDDLFWNLMTALTVVKPIYLNIAGAFKSNLEQRLVDPQRIDLRSNLSLDGINQQMKVNDFQLFYTQDELELTQLLLGKVLYVRGLRNLMPRVNYNIDIFSQMILWEKLHYEHSLFSKLFAFIDSFVCNPQRGNVTLVSSRIAKFLSGVFVGQDRIFEEAIKNRLSDIWSLHRYPDVHGHVKPPSPSVIEIPDGKLNFDSAKDLYDLFEIARLCLYKLLLLPEKDLEVYANIPIPRTGWKESESREADKKRNEAADSFFNKAYENPEQLKAFFNFTN